MIESFFIITTDGEIIIERHFKGRIPRSVAEKFYEKARLSEELKPVMTQPGYYVSHILRNDVYFVGVNTKEMDPLVVTNFLDKLFLIFKSYLSKVDAKSAKGGFVVIYQLLDEIIDHGFTLTTELSLLHDLVKPPRRLISKLSLNKGGSGRSMVPWRKADIKYSNNEIFFDVEEYMNCLVAINGSPSICEINGRIKSNSFLSGMPDILLQFNNPSLFKHVLFHPCVRYAKFEEDQSISFIPPDGEFILLRYKVTNIPNLPLYCRAQLTFFKTGANISIVCSPRHKDGVLENVRIEFPIPYPLYNLKKMSCTQGQVTYKAKENKFCWNIGKFTAESKSCTCTGQISFSQDMKDKVKSPAAVNVFFTLEKTSVSGLRVDRVDLFKENYKPFKGVKYITKNGRYEVRTV